ncbi:MAG TPA: chlorite dismutase family protein [Terriglobales bacterium]|nr:chlorite dismutase family protein [Terriglobales bacterium]
MEKPDLREKGGERGGQRQYSDRRLFMQLLAFGGCRITPGLVRELTSWEMEGVLYEDVNDPQGVALVTWSADPAFFATELRQRLQRSAFSELRFKPDFTMLGRTYAIGHEPDLSDWLLDKPRRSATAPESPWAVWYPLRRAGAFQQLGAEEQSAILREHGTIGHSFGAAGYAQDIRLACFGLDRNDNDFVIGLVGADLHGLSACVQAMRKTRQTAGFIANMGPFFVGRAVWQRLLSERL